MCNDRKNHFRRHLIIVTLVGFYVLISHQAFAWQTILNNPDGADLFRAVAIDGADNVVGAGTTTRANGDRGFVVAKFSGLDGALLWRVEIDGTTNGDDDAFAVTVDNNDDVLAVGQILNQVTNSDVTVLKLAGNTGAELWRRIIDGTANNQDVARAVAIDSANNVVVAGRITDAITSGNFAVIKFSGADGTTQWTWTTASGEAHTVSVNSQNEVIAGGSTNVGFAVVKIDPNGGLVWHQEIPRLACCTDTVFSVALDSHDDVFAAGSRTEDFAAVKLSGNTGAVIWSRQINGAGQGKRANRLAVDPNDNVVVAGFINNGGIGFGWDFTVIKFSGTTGVTQWAQAIDGGAFGAFDEARDLVIDGIGDIYVTGDIATDAFGDQDLAVVKFAGGDGSERWRHMVFLRSRGNALAIDSANNIVAAGEFLQNPGDPDLGVIKLDGKTGFDFPADTPPTVSCVPVLRVKKGHHDDDKETFKHGLFRVSASDSGSAFTITLGGIVLANGEVIKITPKPKPGVRLVGKERDNDDRGRSFKHFQVGPGEALILATDAAGNIGSVVCPLPQQHGDNDDHDRDNHKEKKNEKGKTGRQLLH